MTSSPPPFYVALVILLVLRYNSLLLDCGYTCISSCANILDITKCRTNCTDFSFTLPCHQVQLIFYKPSLLGSRRSKLLEIFSLQQISCHFVYYCFGDHTITSLTQEKLKCMSGKYRQINGE